jgi:methyltransferase-like protein
LRRVKIQEEVRYIDNLKDEFAKVFNEYSDELLHKQTTETTAIELIARRDKELINGIGINDKYRLKYLDGMVLILHKIFLKDTVN